MYSTYKQLIYISTSPMLFSTIDTHHQIDIPLSQIHHTLCSQHCAYDRQMDLNSSLFASDVNHHLHQLLQLHNQANVRCLWVIISSRSYNTDCNLYIHYHHIGLFKFIEKQEKERENNCFHKIYVYQDST